MPKTKRNSALNNKLNSQRSKKAANRTPVGRIARILFLVIAIGLLVGLIYWAMERINNVLVNILSTFGLGLIIMAIGIITLIYLIKQHGVSIVINRWNRVLGIIILALAFWGILSFFYLDKGIFIVGT